MASVLLYLTLSACATAAVGAYAGHDNWEEWSASWDDDEHCHDSSRAGVAAGSVLVGAESRGGCHPHRHSCEADDEGARCYGD
jgi:hypothetical protein